MQHYRAEKAVYREIGEFVAKKEDADKVVKIAGFFKTVDFINVFANLDVQAAPCHHHKLSENFHEMSLLHELQKKDYAYFVWDEKYCSAEELQIFRQAAKQPGVVEVRSWQGKKLGQMVLFKLNDDT
ncbi:MAG: hypothetical protein GQ542_21010 [Desulforhopalus sp.]|nr:hypothetical protein [Desulforhopalus sp.]